MKVSLVWSAPTPEKTIAVAMRRCYSTKPIEEIETELEQKGSEYWKYLMSKALQDKSLDVLEHYTFTLIVDELDENAVGRLIRNFPYMKWTDLGGDGWLLSMNARTLVEIWRDVGFKNFAEEVVAELDRRGTSPIFNSLAFGEKVRAS